MVFAATCSILASACTGGQAPEVATENPSPASAPLPFSNVWSAAPGIDLATRPAELIRATLESADATAYGGIAQSYPGYEAALATTTPRGTPDFEISEWFVQSTPNPYYGLGNYTSFNHMMTLEATETVVSATVCNYLITDTPRRNGSIDGGYGTYQFRLTRNSEPDATPGAPDNDQANTRQDHRTPSWNVFEGWTIERLYATTPPTDLGTEPVTQCAAWINQQFPDFIYNSAGILMPPVRFEENPPTHPVLPQYPEWIPAGNRT